MDSGFIEGICNFSTDPSKRDNGEGRFQTHSHKTAEVTLLMHGQGYYASGEQNMEVAPCDLLLIPADLKHSYVCTKAWEGYSLHVYEQYIPPYCQYLMSLAFSQRPGLILKAALHPSAMERSLTAMRQIEEECRREEQTDYSNDLLRNALESLLLAYHTEVEETRHAEPNGDNPEEHLLQDALKEIHQNYHTSLKVSALAASHFLSESMFRKKFADRFGVSPKQYIISLRIDEAKRLLETSRKPVEFIASEVGFSSSSRFHDLFIKHVGMTPLEWRRNGSP
ncbi:helix-turn-helix domain-containing protein [Paenibacillus sp. GCM10023250]|uniref:helix-turn-helix domain-containing protein n=1 Tax=Paenibacillus sp. GCM10023250 TaxID=3252648 RepID=UPI00361B47B4